MERYTNALAYELVHRGVEPRLLRVAARELQVGPLRFGYQASILFRRLTVRPKGLTHSFLWYAIPPSARIVTIFDLFSYPLMNQEPVTRFLVRGVRSDLVDRPEVYFTISESVRHDVSRVFGIPHSRILVAPPGVDTRRFTPDAGPRPSSMPRDGKITVLHVGHGYARKGIHALVEALGQLDSARFRLVRVGPPTDPGYVARYRARASELGLELVESGVVDDASLAGYYAHADLFVFPSVDEGAGIPPLEAMACGTNVVMSDIPVHHELCGSMATYAPPGPGGLAGAITYALAHPRERSELRAHSEAFSWARTLRPYFEVYRRMGISLRDV